MIAAGVPPIEREIDWKISPVRINDVIGFFQETFEAAVDGMHIPISPHEREILKRGKANRSRMAELPISEVKEYTGIELIETCRMMDKLKSSLSEVGLTLKYWQGAGAIASAMFDKHQSKLFFPRVYVPPEQDWAHFAFFGGRIELCRQGSLSKKKMNSMDTT